MLCVLNFEFENKRDEYGDMNFILYIVYYTCEYVNELVKRAMIFLVKVVGEYTLVSAI